jgi:antitoxin component YwqK of YwqJK toxin-antitoxin module
MIEVKKDYYQNGNIYYKFYYLDEKHHREDGPAFISHYPNGNIHYEAYYKNGESHRENGPAIIYYDEDGNIEHKEYYLNNNELTEQEWFSQLSIENKVKFAFGIEND